MAWPTSLQVALKEWAVVCRALESGRQIILLRKGGIYEAAGEFEVENREFLLFPSYVHQNLKMLKESEHRGFEPRSEELKEVVLSVAGVVTDIVQIKSRQQIDASDDEHVAPVHADVDPDGAIWLIVNERAGGLFRLTPK